MEILIIYNEINKNIKIKENSSIGDIQEKILTTLSLLIYNIENCHIYLESDDSKIYLSWVIKIVHFKLV